MFYRTTLIALLAALPALASAQRQLAGPLPEPLTDAEFAVLAAFFEYDRDSLGVRAVPECREGRCFEVEDRGGHTREKLGLPGPHGEVVPAYLGVPVGGESPHPVVILQHGLNGSKALFWEEGHPHDALREALNAAGFAVLALDAPGHGDRLHEIGYADGPSLLLGGRVHRLRDLAVQAVIEHRRALDALAGRSDLDLTRVGSFGFSQGAMHTLFLTAVDPRVDAAVAWASPMRKNYPLLYPGHFARQIDEAAVLMLAGDRDHSYTVEEAETVLGLVPSDNTRLVVFDGGHQMRPVDIPIAVEWLAGHLGER